MEAKRFEIVQLCYPTNKRPYIRTPKQYKGLHTLAMRILLLLFFVLFHLTACAQSRRARNYLRDAQENARNRNFEEAFEDVQSALNSSPEYVEAWLFKADMHIMMDQNEEALDAYRNAYRYGQMTAILYRWGRASLKNGLYSEADSVLTIYLNSNEANPRYIDDAAKMRDDAEWAMEQVANPVPFDPINLGEQVNILDMQYFPSITADGRTMVFTGRNLQEYEDFYSTTFDSIWSRSELLPGGLNTPGNEGAQSLSADGQTIYYAGCDREGGYGSCDIYVSYKLANGQWSVGRNMGPTINSRMWESQPSISSDGKTMFFVRAVSSRSNNSDIFYTRNVNGEWTEPQRIKGPINTPLAESSPFIHFDNRTLYFSSNGHRGMGESDLYVAKLQPNGEWGEIENLGYPINTHLEEFAMSVAPDGRTAYYSSDREMAGFRKLYSFVLPEQVRASPIAWIKGNIIDDESNAPIDANINFVNLESQERVLEENVGRDGEFQVSLPAQRSYALNVKADGYLFYSENFALENQSEATADVLEIRLKKLKVGDAVVLKNVFYPTDEFTLDPTSEIELDRLASFLKDNPTVRLSVDGHTDDRGSAAYNKELSKNRAQSVVNYLVSEGINPGRLEARGYGDEQPTATNDTEEGRAKNRRTEITILNL